MAALIIRPLLFSFIVKSTISSLLSLTDADSSQNKFVLKLIHRDSKLSPLYDPNATIWELRKRAMHRSLERASYLSKSLAAETNNPSSDVIGIGIRPKDDRSVFLANISIGEPPKPQILVVDTGSMITWVRCEPCSNCGRHPFRLYDPNNSSSFNRILCGQDCWRNNGDSCDEQGSCMFETEYGDGSNITGNLIKEQLIFTTIGGGTNPTQITGVGCAHSVTATSGALDNVSGVLGLGRRNSLADQTDGKFSYCFGDVTDPNYAFNRLVLGQGANLDGDVLSASAAYGQHFFVVMEGISVGEDRLDIDPSVFLRDYTRHDGGVILDTGSLLTDLNKAAYDVLRDEVESLASNRLNKVGYHSDMLCYAGRVDREVSDFPYVTFHFEGGVDLVLGPQSFFLQAEPDVVCMAVTASPARLNVIGVMAQQDYNIGVDTFNAKVYMQSIDCSLYFDT